MAAAPASERYQREREQERKTSKRPPVGAKMGPRRTLGKLLWPLGLLLLASSAAHSANSNLQDRAKNNGSLANQVQPVSANMSAALHSQQSQVRMTNSSLVGGQGGPTRTDQPAPASANSSSSSSSSAAKLGQQGQGQAAAAAAAAKSSNGKTSAASKTLGASTHSPAFNSRLKQTLAAESSQAIQRGGSQIAAEGSHETQAFMSLSSAQTSVSDQLAARARERQPAEAEPELAVKAQQRSAQNQPPPARQAVWPERPARLEGQQASLARQRQQVFELMLREQQQQQQQRLASAQLQLEQTGELEAPAAQVEKPEGYSYERGPLGGYMHTSPLSPARQELLLAEQAASKRRRLHHAHSAAATARSSGGEPAARQPPALAGQLQRPTGPGPSSAASQPLSPPPLANPAHSGPAVGAFGPLPAPQLTVTGTAANPCKPPPSQELVQSTSQSIASLNDLGPPKYRRAGDGMRLRSQFIFKVVRADSLTDCELACSRALALAGNNPQDACRSFNYRAHFAAENCELSRHELRNLKLEDGGQFEQHTQFDFYVLDQATSQTNQALAYSPFTEPDCLDVAQSCTQDGMEFSLRTNEPFNGRIYTHGFYDSCFTNGDGSQTSMLRISRPNGFPRCGTQQFGDLMTNIVVVQFNDYVQTTRDKKYNLTCYFSGPGEAVVTSNYLDTKIDERSHPMQIEHLPPQNVITSNVHLRVLYRGQPTNAIAVGDLLTFRLETKSNLRHRSEQAQSEIFATNVLARDPYSGRQVQLIDARGCPTDPVNVFPELQRTPDGALESEFYAFKIPDSSFLIFQATVRTCKSPCEPAICQATPAGPPPPVVALPPEPTRTAAQYVQAGASKGGYLVMQTQALHQQPSSVPSWGKRRRRWAQLGLLADESGQLDQEEAVERVIPARLAGGLGQQHSPGGLSRFGARGAAQRGPGERERGQADQEEGGEEEGEVKVKEMLRVYLSRAELDRQLRERLEEPLWEAPSGGSARNRTGQELVGVATTAPAGGGQPSAWAPLEDEWRAQEVEQVCVTQFSHYVMLFTVISLSMLVVSVLLVALYTLRRSKFRICNSLAAADSIF